MRMIADGPKSAREPFRIRLPGARLGPPVLAVVETGIPAGVHPPIVKLDTLLPVPFDESDLVLFRCRPHLIKPAAGIGRQDRIRQLAARPRHVVGHHPPPPQVLRTRMVAAIEHQHRQRRPHFLARQKLETRQLLSGRDPHRPLGQSLEPRRPLTRPADDNDQATAGRGTFDVVVRPGAVCRTSAERGEPVFLVVRQRYAERFITVGHAVVPRAVVQVRQRADIQRNIRGEDVLDQRRLAFRGILQTKPPFDHREARVFLDLAGHGQAGLRIRPNHTVNPDAVGRPFALLADTPLLQNFPGRLPGIVETEPRIARRRLVLRGGAAGLPATFPIHFHRQRCHHPLHPRPGIGHFIGADNIAVVDFSLSHR